MAASTPRARNGVCGRQLLAQTSLAPKRTVVDCVASLSLRCALPGPRVGQSAVDSNVHASQAGGNFLHQSSTPAGAPHRCRHKQSQAFCEQSGTTARVRARRPFYPGLALQAAVPDPGTLHRTAINTQARAAVLQTATQVDRRLADLRTWPPRPRARLTRVLQLKATRNEKAW